MQTWIVYGLIGALCFGILNFIIKFLVSPQHFNLSVQQASLFTLSGIGVVFITYFLASPSTLAASPKYMALGMVPGILWGIAMIFIFTALRGGADVARIVPIYNTNSLIVVLLAILLLKEIPYGAETVKVVLGAALIVVGAILVS